MQKFVAPVLLKTSLVLSWWCCAVLNYTCILFIMLRLTLIWQKWTKCLTKALVYRNSSLKVQSQLCQQGQPLHFSTVWHQRCNSLLVSVHCCNFLVLFSIGRQGPLTSTTVDAYRCFRLPKSRTFHHALKQNKMYFSNTRKQSCKLGEKRKWK